MLDHPADQQHRAEVLSALARLRAIRSPRWDDVAARLGTKPAASRKWMRTNLSASNPSITMIQRWGGALDATVTINLDGIGRHPTDERVVLAATMARSQHLDQQARDAWALTHARARLAATASVIGRRAVAARLGINHHTLSITLGRGADMQLATLQRIARACGGTATMRIMFEPVVWLASDVRQPCGTDGARRNHLAHGEDCDACGTDASDRTPQRTVESDSANDPNQDGDQRNP